MASLKLVAPHEVDWENPIEGDLFIYNNNLVIVTGVDEVAQAIRCRLRMFRGEWFLDLREGVPYIQEVFRKVGGQRLPILKAMFRNIIVDTNGVESVREIDLVPSEDGSRHWLLSFIAVTTDGAVLESSTFGPFVVTVPEGT